MIRRSPVKILWLSDSSFVISAYGQQAALFLPRLRAVGHDVVVQATDVLGRSAGGTALNLALRDGTRVRAWDQAPVDLVFSLADPHVLDRAACSMSPWIA